VNRALIASIGIIGLVAGVQGATAQYPGGPDPSRGASGRGVLQPSTPVQEFHGPTRFGGNCVVVTDKDRGYGYMKGCPPAKGSAKAAAKGKGSVKAAGR
jgi:hypothetical protein